VGVALLNGADPVSIPSDARRAAAFALLEGSMDNGHGS
jgi:hypothetical protein